MNRAPTLNELRQRARWHRAHPTRAEALMWSQVRKRRLGTKFRRQYVLYPFIVDFYCHEFALCVEVDGPQHDPASDARRDRILRERYGVRVVRTTSEDVERNAWKVAQRLRPHLTP